MNQILIACKPVSESSKPFLLVQNGQKLCEYKLARGNKLTVKQVVPPVKYCVGWYDIAAHTNHTCENSSKLDTKYSSCFSCRQKIGFNPGFYNTEDISDKQRAYNNSPHSVYVAYFGGELFKAGIMSDSRGLQRLFEQGALWYSIVGTFDNANQAHKLEGDLISQGLRNSVTKSQKTKSYENLYRVDTFKAREALRSKLNELGLPGSLDITDNISTYFFDEKPTREITPLPGNFITGTVFGVIGSYLIVKNSDRLFGMWLDKLYGYEVEISEEVNEIEADPVQVSLL